MQSILRKSAYSACERHVSVKFVLFVGDKENCDWRKNSFIRTILLINFSNNIGVYPDLWIVHLN